MEKFRKVVWYRKENQKVGKCKHSSEIIKEMIGGPADWKLDYLVVKG